WKLPETTLILPWIVKMYPDNQYIYSYRDPRDSILGAHMTDDLADFGIQYDRSDDALLTRAISWKYQAMMMRATPEPGRTLRTRFEDYVLSYEPEEELAEPAAR
ncbi:MAG: sulfotransferase, partial [Pirellulales bacterium]